MAALLRQAHVSLKIIPADAGEAITIEARPGSGLRVVYDVVRTADAAPNVGTITIYNLAEATRAKIAGAIRADRLKVIPPSDQSPFNTDALFVEIPEVLAARYGYAYVELQAGYDAVLARVHEGTSSRIRNRHRGVDWETTLAFGDGEAPLAHAVVDLTFERGQPVWEAIKKLVEKTGLISGNVNRKTWESLDTFGGQFMGDQYFATAYTPQGDPVEQLSLILSAYGVRMFIDQGEVWLLGRSGYLPDPIVELGVPRAEPEDTEDGIVVEVLHNPLLRPGVRARVQSRRSSDVWFVDAVRFAGDSHGELLCNVELVPVASMIGG